MTSMQSTFEEPQTMSTICFLHHVYIGSLHVLKRYSYLSDEFDYQIHNVTNVVNKLLSITHAIGVYLFNNIA